MKLFLHATLAAALLTGFAHPQSAPHRAAPPPSLSGDSDDEGALPATSLTEFTHCDADMTMIEVGGAITDGLYFQWDSGVPGLPLDVVLTEDGILLVSIGGTLIAPPMTINDLVQLPGGQEHATAGTTACWMVPNPFGGSLGPVKVQVVGHGATLAEAVQDYKQKIAGLKAAGWKPVPAAACG